MLNLICVAWKFIYVERVWQKAPCLGRPSRMSMVPWLSSPKLESSCRLAPVVPSTSLQN